MKIIKLNIPINQTFGLYSAIRSIELPDGTSFIPDRCLADKDLTEATQVINERTEMITDILDLPEVGEPVAKDVVYQFTEGEETKLVICQQPHDRTIYAPSETPALFTFFRTNSDDLEWIPNEKVETGWKRMYNGVQYEVIQSHMTVEGQTPDLTPALWNVVSTSSEWTIGVSYTIGDVVTYQGSEYECRQSHTSQAGWTPPSVLSLWLPL